MADNGRDGGFARRDVLIGGALGLAAAGQLSTMAAAQGGQKQAQSYDIPNRNTSETLPGFTAPSERHSPPSQPPLVPRDQIGFAVVGLGRLALEEVIPALQQSKLGRLAAVVTGDPAKGGRVADQHGLSHSSVYGYAEIERLRDNPDIKAVYVVTPNGLHRDHVLLAARAGKHVLCEKPMAVSSAQAREMIGACAAASVKLMIAYRCQYEPNHRAMIKLVREKTYGDLKLIEAHNGQVQGDPQQWRHNKALAGGGALPDVGLYCLNMARYVTGEEPVEVYGSTWSKAGDPRFAEVEENCAWQMRFPSGVVARLATAYDAHEARRLRLYFERGWVDMDPAFSYSGLKLKVGRTDGDDPEVELIEEQKRVEKNQFMREIDHFCACILTNTTPLTPGEEGEQDHKIMEAIYMSAATNLPVKLDRVDQLDAFRGPPPLST